MNIKTLLMAIVCLILVVCLGLAISNPSSANYRQVILRGVAEQEVNHQEQTERQAIEREAASLESYFSAVHYEGRRLDSATIQRQYPKLGTLLVNHHASTNDATLSERLMQVRQQALQRVTITRETLLYSLLADLSMHTTRTSYAVWSHFSTCHNNRVQNYLAVAGQFYEEAAGACLSPR